MFSESEIWGTAHAASVESDVASIFKVPSAPSAQSAQSATKRARTSDFSFGSSSASNASNASNAFGVRQPIYDDSFNNENDAGASFSSIITGGATVPEYPRPEELIAHLAPDDYPRFVQGTTTHIVRSSARQPGAPLVGFEIHQAAQTLMDAADADGTLNLSAPCRSNLRSILQCQCDTAIIDPLVCIEDSLFTGTCQVHMYQMVPVSWVLMAVYLRCTYSVVLFEGASPSKAKPLSEARIRGCELLDMQSSPLGQSFGLEELVRAALEARRFASIELRLLHVRYYMARLGCVSSAEAASRPFLEQHTQMMGAVLNNTATSEGQQEDI